MISTQHLFTEQETLQESAGLIAAGAFGILGLIAAATKVKSTNIKFNKIENELIEAYKDDYLSITLELESGEKDKDTLKKLLNTLTIGGRFRNKIIKDDVLALVVNRKTVNYCRQKLGKYPMFKMLGTNSTYKQPYDKFISDHKSLFGFLGSSTFSKNINTVSDEEVTSNLQWLHFILTPFIKGQKLETVVGPIKNVIITSKKLQTVSQD